MTDSSATAATSVWTTPQCPFTIEYSLQALDDIRLAVTDAFFSLPRGGAEIGGVLLGTWQKGKLAITDYVALDCEHAFGPSFSLSRNDETRLQALLDASYPNVRVVGWYHSHTRSEIFLSQADLEIHRRFFPNSWQVAMVLRPHTFQPMRIGFFFRESDSNIHSEASYREDKLTPLPMKPLVGNGSAADSQADGPPPPISRAQGGARDNPLVAAAASLAAARQLEMEPETVSKNGAGHQVVEAPVSAQRSAGMQIAPDRAVTAPSFGMAPAEDRAGVWPWALALAALVAICWAGYATRDVWWPKVSAMLGHETALPPAIGLNLIDREGQLQIHWNAQSPAIERAAGGVLRISGAGPFPQEITLDKAHLQNGYFTFQRQSERVDVALIIPQPTGAPAAEITTYMGKMPDKKPIFVEDPEAQKQRDKLATQVDQMQNQLTTQQQENQKLKNSVEQLHNQLNLQTRKRLTNQDKQ